MENGGIEKRDTTRAKVPIATVQILIVVRLEVVCQKQFTAITDVEIDLLVY